MKKVSIVVPVYKSEAFLPKLIDSVLGQSYTNFELILVDDESPDNSGKICDDYAQKDKRILVIHKKNGGCCDARNKGLEVATGEYLMLADGDDWLETDCVEYLVGLMEKMIAKWLLPIVYLLLVIEFRMKSIILGYVLRSRLCQTSYMLISH